MEWEKQFDEVALSKGKSLCGSKRVIDLKKSETEITATITGNPRHDVSIGLRSGRPVRMWCQCPKFRGRRSCEHLAAALYAAYGGWQEEAGTVDTYKKTLADYGYSREEEAQKAAIIEAARKAAQEETVREQARKELAQRIAQREAEKKAKRAERKKKRQEAQEAQLKLQLEKVQKREEQEEKLRLEEEQRALVRAREEAEREAEKRVAQEEAARRKEEKVRAAIARKEQQKAEAAANAAQRGLSQKELLGEKQVQRVSAARSDAYHYFDFDTIRETMRISPKNRKQGTALRQSGDVWLNEVRDGYTSNMQEMVAEVVAAGREKKRGEFPIHLVFTKDEIIHVNCGCRECRSKYWVWDNKHRDCAYVSGALELAAEYTERHEMGDATDKTAQRVLDVFNKKRANLLMAQTGYQEDSLLLEPRLQKQESMLRLSFRVGEKKLYVVKDLFAFCSHVKNSETAVYGTSTKINHHLENFTPESRQWYSFISKVIQEEERLEQRMEDSLRYAYRGSKLNALELYGWRLDQFFDMMTGRTIEYETKTSNGKEKNSLSFKEATPRAVMQIKRSGRSGKQNFDGISVSCRMPEFFYGVDRAYFVEGGSLCRAQKDEMERLQVLAETSNSGWLNFQVGRRQLSEFYYSVLPALGESVEVKEENAEEIHSYLPPEVRFIFYLDAADQDLICRPQALYGEREVSLMDYVLEEEGVAPEAFRMNNREQEVLYQVMQLFPVIDQEYHALCCDNEEERIYQVLEHGVEDLMELGEVRCTNRFRSMNLIRHIKVAVGVSVSEGMLDLDISTEDISRQELLDILKSYRTRQKYYRLKNGDFLNLEDNSLEMLSELMETMRLSPKEFVKGKMHLPAYRALYMDKLLEENENIYNTRDSHFRKMVKNFKTVSDADFEEPESLSHILRGYQKNGYKWLKTLETYGFGGILADDMGLGKTLQMIAVLLAAKQEGQQGISLIVSPASLVYNWEEELHRFAPQLKVAAVAGSQEMRREKLARSREYDVLVTSYDLLKRDIDQYEEQQFLYEVIDEAQYIKNHTTAAAKAVKVIKSRHRFALTGTPIENRLSELWSIFDYLMPGFLYGYDVFKKELEAPIAKASDEGALKRLQKMTGPFILRRLKQDVLKDLPDKLEEVRFVQLDEVQRRAYDGQVVHMQEQLGMQSAEDFNKNKMQILAELTRLRQICCDPALCFENYRGESAKLEACMELIGSAIDGGHKILLFSQFTTMLEILQKRLEEAHIPFYTITGATAKEKRLQMVKDFNRDDTPLFLISLKAGGVGLNLTGADVVIHYDPWWNLAAQDQATDRAHRIGQTKKVTVYKLIARQTVEEKILKLQEKKRDLADSIVNAQEGQLAGMSREDLLALLEA